ncbi:MAG: ABC transporter ATP-binding protein [Candidatus Pacebacteria bacterium]|nr:ABC transporter ATP-binding protein [Candidatus Paceibacterota bacterium]
MKKDSKVTIKQIFSEYLDGLKGYKILLAFSVILTVIGSVIGVYTPYFYKDFFNIVNNIESKQDIAKQLISIIFLIAGLNFLNWLFNRTSYFIFNHIEANAMAKIKQNSFNYLIKHSHNFFTNSFTGGLVQKINRQARAFERLFDTIIFNVISLIITIVGAIIITFLTSKILSLIILCWVVIYFSLSFIFYRWKMKLDLEVSSNDSITTALLSDNISNNQTISLFNGYNREINSYFEATKKQSKAMLKAWDIGGIYDAVQLLGVYIAEVVIFYYAIKYWEVDKLTVGGIVMVQIYIISLSKQIWAVNMILRNVFESLADSKEMTEIMLTPHEIQNSNSATDLKISKGEIEFKNVIFNFNETRTVLDNINCRIMPGEKIALVGPSGAGKTTFVRLILRLYNLTGGQILIDGQNVDQVTQESLRENISLVPQDPILFHRTLKDNIRYGKPEATDEEVVNASKLAHCADFIDVLPNKYDTLVGERGIKLSGGERQRIAIARAILKNAPILILDEATSSLDSHSEALIQKALDNLMKGRTTIAIAHRLSTIRKMDRIIVMKDGKIIEEGTHDELSNKDSGLYKDLWELQAGGFVQE